MICKFPEIVSRLRRSLGISQKQAAIELGISQALLSHYEKGIRECSLDFLIKVSNYYNVSCDYLLGKTKKTIESQGCQDIKEQTMILNNFLECVEKSCTSESYDKALNMTTLSVYRIIRLICDSCVSPAAKYSLDKTSFAILSQSVADFYALEISKDENEKGALFKNLTENDINNIKSIVSEAEALIRLKTKN